MEPCHACCSQPWSARDARRDSRSRFPRSLYRPSFVSRIAPYTERHPAPAPIAPIPRTPLASVRPFLHACGPARGNQSNLVKIRKKSTMSNKDFAKLVSSIREAGRIRRGEARLSRVTEFAPMDVKAIRRRLGKSQSAFAHMIGVSVSTLQNWEQGRRRPEGPARALIKVAAENPEA